MKTKRFIGVLLAAIMATGGFQAAIADSETKSLEAVHKIAPEVFEGQASQRRSPQTLKQGVLFTFENRGIALEVRDLRVEKSLGFRGAGYRVLTATDGIDYIPVAKSDGSVQTAAVLHSAESGEQLIFKLKIPKGATASLLEAGEVVILDPSGKMLAGISAPWALDDKGQAVETWYELAEGELIQHVEHRNRGFDYPIVADPWLGLDLYGWPSINIVSGQGYRINVTPTNWGVSFDGPGTWFAHRDEVVTKLGSQSWRWTTTIQEQFYCHIAGLPFSLPEYNMESWSPLVNWFASLTLYRCNPYSGSWF